MIADSPAAVRKRPRAPTAVAMNGGSGGLPPTRPAALPPQVSPETRQRVCGEAQCRLNDSLTLDTDY